VQRAGIPREGFSVHSFQPEGFLVVFASAAFQDQVATRPSLPFRHFTLFFRRWTRLASAQRVLVESKVHLAIRGSRCMPGIALRRSTFRALDELGPETASRGCFGFPSRRMACRFWGRNRFVGFIT
jgi:hypothetical protein